MPSPDYTQYIGVLCDFEIEQNGTLTGVIFKSESEALPEYYFIKSKDILDYKVAYLQKNEAAIMKLHERIDLRSITKIRLVPNTGF